MNPMRRRVAAAVLTVAAAATTALLTSETASAAPTGCPSGYACVWKDIHYSTAGTGADSYKFFYYQAHFGSVKYTGTGYYVGDSASSAYNHGTSGEAAYFFKDASCSGSRFKVSAGSGDSDFTNGSPSGGFNDVLSSGAFASELGGCYSA